MPDDRPVLKVCGITRVADMRGAEAAGADFCGFITQIERSPRCLTREQAVLLARGCRIGRVLVVEDMPPADIAELAEAVDAHAVQLHGGDADYLRKVAETLDAAVPLGGAGLHSRPHATKDDGTLVSPSGVGDCTRSPRASSGDTRASGSRGRECNPAPPDDWTEAPSVAVWRPIGLPEECEDRAALVEETLAEIDAALETGASAIVLDTRTSEGTGGSGRTCDWEAAAEIVRRTDAPVLLAGGLSPENLREALETTGAAGADLSSSLEARPGCKSPSRLRALGEAWRVVAEPYGAEGL
jgi:phosphoribosylanthranilate isomerase